jgi:hypothetical protein
MPSGLGYYEFIAYLLQRLDRNAYMLKSWFENAAPPRMPVS